MVTRIHRNCFQARKTIDSQWVREERNLARELMQQNSAIELELSNGTRPSDGHLFNFTWFLFVDSFSWTAFGTTAGLTKNRCIPSLIGQEILSGGNLKGNP
jgi:hypothetical protein